MKILRCCLCDKECEAHDYADLIICDTCELPKDENDADTPSTETVR